MEHVEQCVPSGGKEVYAPSSLVHEHVTPDEAVDEVLHEGHHHDDTDDGDVGMSDQTEERNEGVAQLVHQRVEVERCQR